MRPDEAKLKSNPKRPNVFAYSDYRAFLSDFFIYKKNKNPHFSYLVFARKMGKKTKAYVKRIIDGSRALPLEAVSAASQACQLSSEESRYFELLVHMSRVPFGIARELMTSKSLNLIAQSVNPISQTEADKPSQNSFWCASASIALKMSEISSFKSDVREFLEMMSQRYRRTSPADSVFQLNLQAFPLSETK